LKSAHPTTHHFATASMLREKTNLFSDDWHAKPSGTRPNF
jgi:hypothetical protein